MEMSYWAAKKKDILSTKLTTWSTFPITVCLCEVRHVGIIATEKAVSWHAAAKGRRASLCIDADDERVHGKEKLVREKKCGVGVVGRHWMSDPSHHTLHPLRSQHVELLVWILWNEVASGEAAICGPKWQVRPPLNEGTDFKIVGLSLRFYLPFGLTPLMHVYGYMLHTCEDAIFIC